MRPLFNRDHVDVASFCNVVCVVLAIVGVPLLGYFIVINLNPELRPVWLSPQLAVAQDHLVLVDEPVTGASGPQARVRGGTASAPAKQKSGPPRKKGPTKRKPPASAPAQPSEVDPS